MSRKTPSPAEPEKHSMKGWGARFADWNEPRTLEEASVMAQLAAADRMLECMTDLSDIKYRLARLEKFLYEQVPGYAQSQAHNPPDLSMLKAIAGVKVT